ncbi:hypothetical protein [Tenacibaculum amylolyticum]|uniref:hypothetical protein n=1 Tax=Tenacibaculum amylolyticum TaxID=104269 RepID=UPI0038931804
MLKNVGTPLTKEQQKSINGGYKAVVCRTRQDCVNAFPHTGPWDFSCVRRGLYSYCVPN